MSDHRHTVLVTLYFDLKINSQIEIQNLIRKLLIFTITADAKQVTTLAIDKHNGGCIIIK